MWNAVNSCIRSCGHWPACLGLVEWVLPSGGTLLVDCDEEDRNGAVWQESMRMLPVLSGTNRMSDKDIMLGGYLIPRNTMIWCNLNAAMNNPAIWENPDVFLPVSHSES